MGTFHLVIAAAVMTPPDSAASERRIHVDRAYLSVARRQLSVSVSHGPVRR